MSEAPKDPGLLGKVAAPLELTELQETAWIEVIQKVDEVYSDLIRYEVELERKNTELEEAHGFIANILSSMSEILIVCDPQRRIQNVNAACLQLTGLGERDLVGKPIGEIVSEADQPRIQRLCAGQSGSAVDYVEVRFRTAGGGTSDPVSLNSSTLIDHDNRPAGVVLIGRPMGELRRAYRELNDAHSSLKRAQQQLVQSEKMASLGRLVAGVAHELNNPISFIYGNAHSLESYRQKLVMYLEAIHEGVDEDKLAQLRQRLRIDHILGDLAPLVEGTREGAARVSDIVKSLRRLSFTGKEQPEAFDLVRVLKTAAQWSSRGSGRRRVDLELDLPEEMTVTGHDGQIHQVVVNLIENALDAVEGSDTPRVSLSGQTRDGEAVVTLRDNGPGIPDSDLMRIFDPFFTTKSVGEGTGLGLWISYGIVKDHGGTLKAVNRESGAEFTFTLPLAQNLSISAHLT